MNPHVFSVPPPRPSRARWVLLAGIAAGIIAFAVVAAGLLLRRSGPARRGGADAIVRVVLKSHAGTGFFVAGPDDAAYVATAYHVVASGETLLVERTIDDGADRRYVEAYPDAEVVAFDDDADLAIVRLNGVRSSRFPRLALASQPAADEPILSYGFPASSLASRSGLVSKPGKILSLVKFPVVDRRTGDVLRSDAVDGLLVSAEIEPGFSGGPTCNDRGEVVGVNVTKDTVHRAQNGAVSIGALKALLAQVTPRKNVRDPSPDDVKALLARVEREYLLLPLDRRSAVREEDYVSAGDMPRVEQLITEIRKLQGDTERDSTTKLSGPATLGLVLARLPGQPLETTMDRATRKALADCETRQRGLEEFFGGLGAPGAKTNPSASAEAARARCSALAFRPLVWDLTAMALEWEGREREISVTKVESVDPERHVYRAAVRFSGIDYLVDVWVATDGGRLRLRLFDHDGKPSGLSVARNVAATAFGGTWHRVEPRTSRELARGVGGDVETEETLVVSVGTDNVANLTHQVRRHVWLDGGRRFACGGSRVDLGFEQSFAGPLQDGSIVAARQQDPKPIGSDMARCWSLFTYAPDQVIVLKRSGSKLLMVRTDGLAYPETAEFQR
jgi:hypothetical protein